MRLPRTILAGTAALTLVSAAACGGGGGDAQRPAGATALYDALPDSIKETGVIRFAGDSHPPYRIVANDGKTVTGIDKELQDALGKVLGVRTEISIVNGLPAALSGMLASRYDAFNGPVKDSAEREKQFDAIVWMVTRTSYLIPKAGSAAIKSSGDLCGKRVAGTAGSIVEDQAKRLTEWCTKHGKPGIDFMGLADTNGTILAAKSGRADAAGMTESAALDVLGKEKDAFTYVTQTDEQGAGVDQLAMLVPKSSGLGPVMLDAFKKIFENGEYKKIMDKYGLQNVAVPEPKMNTAATP
ncbi:transporter substrate-binding domain-containing protein [Nonomuraea sp. FMUSA5-5]|uniref:Transporter substrate-binding domain-containing protein n=1 Tax=Nonomuraea composti TaxID=2720023 RepID=A0ABX1BRT1_9ACTN|nr:transporter substrate-binding domain-containing protein [Nonomuraea sp. FMUSA5-5]NJP97908.1 transporter substrate-binding domain-containing protein [Nonomuraea sp. FMUSA5-5]